MAAESSSSAPKLQDENVGVAQMSLLASSMTIPVVPNTTPTTTAFLSTAAVEVEPEEGDDEECEVGADWLKSLEDVANYRVGAGRQLSYTESWSTPTSSAMVLGSSSSSGVHPNMFSPNLAATPLSSQPTVVIQQTVRATEDEGEESEEDEWPDTDIDVLAQRALEEVEDTGFGWLQPFGRFFPPTNKLLLVHGELYNLCKGGTDNLPCWILGRWAIEEYQSTGKLEWIFDDVYWTFIADNMVALLDSPKDEFIAALALFKHENAQYRDETERRRATLERERAQLDVMAAEEAAAEEAETVNADALASTTISPKTMQFPV